MKVLEGETPFAIAHRGSRLLWPENTLLAFENAHDAGFRWLETDLHMTSDGVLVCLHDDTVDRTTDGKGPVHRYSFDELRALDAGHAFVLDGAFPYRGAGLSVPSLEEVALTFDDCRLVLDLKQKGLVAPLWDLIRRLGIEDRVIVGSFSDRRLREFRRVTGGAVATSAGPAAVLRSLTGGRVRPLRKLADALQIPPSYRGIALVTLGSVRRFHAAGYQVHVWTVNSSKQMHRLLDFGVDGIITDRPDALKAVMIERGEWTGA